MSCLDVMYQVYGPPQPYFAAAYSPYHQVCAGGSGEEAPGGRGVIWRMAVWGLTKRKKGKGEGEGKGWGKIWEAAMVIGAELHPTFARGSAGCSPRVCPPAAIYGLRAASGAGFTKRKKGKGEGEGKGWGKIWEAAMVIGAELHPTFARGSAGCSPRVCPPAAIYGRGRALGKGDPCSLGVHADFPLSLSPPSHSLYLDGSFPMSQRSFPPSFWNSTYQPSSVPATLSSPLAAAAHSELPFAAMHEGYGPHFDPRYGSLLVPTASVRPHRLTPASVPTPVSPQCELGKSEAGAAAAWTTPGPFPNTTGDMAQSLGLNVDAARRYSFCGGSLLS
nr:PREDICTED: transcription cofactor vestigial-like protein 2 [Struthio camelus australis]